MFPIRPLKITGLVATLTALLTFCGARPSFGLAIYEPDSPFNAAPNQATSLMAGGESVPAQVHPGGAELVKAHPGYANAIVSLDAHGKTQSDVYIKLKRVLRIAGDDGSKANAIANSLNAALAKGELRPDEITPGRHAGHYVILAGQQPIVTVDRALAIAQGTSPTTLVLRWLDGIRAALGGVPFAEAASRGGNVAFTRVGYSSWYGPGFNGRRAADGSRFNQNAMTAANKTLPLGTLLLVTNLRNKQSAIVRVTDRGPYVPGRMLDLSEAAAAKIGMLHSGVARVRIDVLKL